MGCSIWFNLNDMAYLGKSLNASLDLNGKSITMEYYLKILVLSFNVAVVLVK